MLIIGSVKEDLTLEKRISITPEIVKKYTSLGFVINLEKNYAEHLGINDDEYKKSGANINISKEEVFEKSNIILKVGDLSTNEFNLIKNKSILIGQFDNNLKKDSINQLIKKEVKIFSLNLLPRITRAQSMDVLSSQANLAGYKAVIESFSKFEKAVPMMMTAAGTVPAAKVLVIGAGVAGLQAIATAKRMGAIVFATDVRATSKEQVESLGGKFLMVEDSENLETEGGYAKETSEDFKKKQESLLIETLKKIDIVICTALIPGKKAPLIIKENMISNMKSSALIYDLAAAKGGNAAFTEVDKVIIKNGVKIMGERNILNKLPVSSSNLYAKNLFNFILNLYDKKNEKININLEDEIIEKTLIK
jgi:H+-translocating NAD(P) transhydrogenase subunit alpha